MRHRLAIQTLAAILAVLLLGALWIYRDQPHVLASESADAAAIAKAIDRLPVVGSVLLAAAHPDDENSQLLPYLARGLHLRTAYLSATRGDGGQNLLGNEQYEALGILRTEELLAARRLDGAEQFFAQAFDFGFSKSAEETMEKWGREQVLGDFVRVIRKFRPDIIISRFTGTSRDGHGNHQAAGILTREAFRAAADPQRFPEQLEAGLRPWQASKLFLNLRGAADDSVTVSLEGFDPLYGRTYAEIGTEARSMHRSQGMGRSRGRGPYFASFSLLDSASPAAAPPEGLFDGMDLTLNRFTQLSGGSDAVARRVRSIEQDIATAKKMLSPTQPSAVVPSLARGLDRLRELRNDFRQSQQSEQQRDHALFLLALKEADFIRAIGMAAGMQVDALADSAEVVPSEPFTVTVTGIVRGLESLQLGEVTLQGPDGWKIEKLASDAAPGGSGDRTEAKFRVTMPGDTPVSQPYWMVEPRAGAYFPVTDVPWIGAAQNPALLTGSVQYEVAGEGSPVEVVQQSDVIYRFYDRIYGKQEQPVSVVPNLGVWVEPAVAIFPLDSDEPQPLLVKLRNNTSAEQQGVLRLDLPPGWQSDPPRRPFTLAERGEEISARFEVSAPAAKLPDDAEAQSIAVKAVAEAKGQSYSTSYEIVDYPHVQARHWFRPAASQLLRFDVKIASGLRVGYIMGSGDNVPGALERLGVSVEQLGPEALAFGDLGEFDAIVTGIRAYEVRDDLIIHHDRLMEYVHDGGSMIVQYSRPIGISPPIGPYPMDQGGRAAPRITVEEAPVEILASHPVFQSPNRITEKDFEGWVQERGLYFMVSWDPQYQALVSSHDPGEPDLKGGMLVASYGKGLYVYSAYSWFRQLPAGVPGAYRIFANLLSLSKNTR
ncbi:MAG: PIG-L family deacetylase [Acidobacteria bacterium]|nr:PIG-L family deacetylase [Acidobacteriota bacterium]